MRRAPGGPAKLRPALLGFALLALLGWRLLQLDGGESSVPERTVPGRPSPSMTARVQGVEVRDAEGPGIEALPHDLSMPVAGVDPRTLHGSFSESRGGTRMHEALDIPAPRGTPVLAAHAGVVRKLFTSVPGGRTVYEFDLEERYCYYYAHLDGYAPGLHEGQLLREGDRIGTVGTTGNAPKESPHLHFAISRLDPDKKWWTGKPIDPYPLLVGTP